MALQQEIVETYIYFLHYPITNWIVKPQYYTPACKKLLDLTLAPFSAYCSQGCC